MCVLKLSQYYCMHVYKAGLRINQLLSLLLFSILLLELLTLTSNVRTKVPPLNLVYLNKSCQRLSLILPMKKNKCSLVDLKHYSLLPRFSWLHSNRKKAPINHIAASRLQSFLSLTQNTKISHLVNFRRNVCLPLNVARR